MSFNYKLTLAYDGTHYHGWQIQPNGISIQEILQNCLKIILRHEVKVIGSGRTDAGVHALGQVAHFRTNRDLDIRSAHHSINGLLPKDIRVKELNRAPENFHAQHSAKGKVYHYHLHLAAVSDPFTRLYSLHHPASIDRELLQQAAKLFIGTHDFTSFSNQAHLGSAAIDPIRTLYRLDIIEENEGLRLEFEGNGFLYKMVRNITGALLAVATGKIDINDIPAIFAARDRRKAAQAAPSHGLFLVKVIY